MPEFDPQTRARLERGEVLIETEDVGAAMPRVKVTAIIECKPERVWQIVSNVADYPRTMEGVKKAQQLSHEGDIVRARITVKMPFPLKDLTATTEARHTVVEGERYERAWKLVEGDYKENSGRWLFETFEGDPGRTLVTYELLAIPNIRIPAALQGLAQKKVLPKLINNLRRQVT